MPNPLYFRSSNPGLGSVNAKANKLYEWDGTGAMPAELTLGKGAMPPAEISGETTIWSDSFTLGYTNEADAHPMFWSDGGAGDAKVLEMINHFAGRLGQPLFSDVVAAKVWAETAAGLYSSWAAAVAPGPAGWDNTVEFRPWSDGGFTASTNDLVSNIWATMAYPAVNGVNSFSIFFTKNAATAAFADLRAGDIVRLEQPSGDYAVCWIAKDIWHSNLSIPGGGSVQGYNPMLVVVEASGVLNTSLPTTLKFQTAPVEPTYSLGAAGGHSLTITNASETEPIVKVWIEDAAIGSGAGKAWLASYGVPSGTPLGNGNTAAPWLPIRPGHSVTLTDVPLSDINKFTMNLELANASGKWIYTSTNRAQNNISFISAVSGNNLFTLGNGTYGLAIASPAHFGVTLVDVYKPTTLPNPMPPAGSVAGSYFPTTYTEVNVGTGPHTLIVHNHTDISIKGIMPGSGAGTYKAAGVGDIPGAVQAEWLSIAPGGYIKFTGVNHQFDGSKNIVPYSVYFTGYGGKYFETIADGEIVAGNYSIDPTRHAALTGPIVAGVETSLNAAGATVELRIYKYIQ